MVFFLVLLIFYCTDFIVLFKEIEREIRQMQLYGREDRTLHTVKNPISSSALFNVERLWLVY